MDYNESHPLLATLNPAQAQAVSLPIGPAQIVAGPGSGKTRVLTHRIAWLVMEHEVLKSDILAVTFTNKAAGEMRSRALDLLSTMPYTPEVEAPRSGMDISTFHSICARILREDYAHTPYRRNWVILDSDDQKAVLKRVMNQPRMTNNDLYPILSVISQAKDQAMTASDFAQAARSRYYQRIAPVYTAYERELQANNALDFDDLLMHTLLLFQQQPDILAKYRYRWPHVLVDEFQDTNAVQYLLIQMLTDLPGPRSLFVVGDEDQSIYAFRGANRHNLARLCDDYPDIHTVVLAQNYRSTQTILDVANSLIQNNDGRIHKDLFTDNGGQSPVRLLEAVNNDTEAEWIAQHIAESIEDGIHNPDGIAVMYRTHAISRALEESFMKHSIPYRLIGSVRFYDRAEIKDALAYMRFMVNPSDALSFSRLVSHQIQGVGARTLETILDCRDAWGLSIADTLTVICHGPQAIPELDRDTWRNHAPTFPARALKPLSEFEALTSRWRHRLQTAGATLNAGDFLESVLEESGFRKRMEDAAKKNEQDAYRVDNLDELVGLASDFDMDPSGSPPVERFLEHVSLVSSADMQTDDQPRVTLMTLHSAKGLEFPSVYIVGADEGLLPHFRAVKSQDPDEIEEERRLFYVGITRAEKDLTITRSSNRYAYGSSRPHTESRFLGEITPSLLRREQCAGSYNFHDYSRRTPFGGL